MPKVKGTECFKLNLMRWMQRMPQWSRSRMVDGLSSGCGWALYRCATWRHQVGVCSVRITQNTFCCSVILIQWLMKTIESWDTHLHEDTGMSDIKMNQGLCYCCSLTAIFFHMHKCSFPTLFPVLKYLSNPCWYHMYIYTFCNKLWKCVNVIWFLCPLIW